MASRRKGNVDELKLDLTAMIDVVFLLIIFFILLPQRNIEGQLESYLPNEGTTKPKTDDPPETVFNIIMKSNLKGGDEILTSLSFNNMPMGDFVTKSTEALNAAYKLDGKSKDAYLNNEYERDKLQFHPENSVIIRKLLESMVLAAKSSENLRETDILVDASSDVPFKVVLAILNAAAGANFTNLKFVRPPDGIWKVN